MAIRSSKKETPAVQVTPEVETKPIIFETADVDQIITDILSQPCDKVGVIDFKMFLTRFIARVPRLLDGIESALHRAAEMEIRELLMHLDKGFHPMTFIEDLNVKLTRIKFESPTYHPFNPQSTEEIPKMNPEETKSPKPFIMSRVNYTRIANQVQEWGIKSTKTYIQAVLLLIHDQIEMEDHIDATLKVSVLNELQHLHHHPDDLIAESNVKGLDVAFNNRMTFIQLGETGEFDIKVQSPFNNHETTGHPDAKWRHGMFVDKDKPREKDEAIWRRVKELEKSFRLEIGRLWEAVPARNDQFAAEYQRQQLKGLMRQPGTAYGQVGVPITDYPQGYPSGDVYDAMLESQKRARDVFYQGRSDNTVNLTCLKFNEICRDALNDIGIVQAGQDIFTAHSIAIAKRLHARFEGVYPVASQLTELVIRLQHQTISRVPYTNMEFFAGARQLIMDHVKSLKIDESTPPPFQSRAFIPR